MEANKQDRRRDVRVTFQSKAKLVFGEKVFDDCETRDISVSGVFVSGVGGIGHGARCAVEFRLVGRTSTLVMDMSGEVVRVEDGGVGLQFFDVDRDSFCHLKNIVYFNYKNPAELGDEYGAEAADESSAYISSPNISDLLAPEDNNDDEYSFNDADDIDLDLVSRVRKAEDDDVFD